MKSRIILAMLIFLVWCLLNWPIDLQNGLVGIGAAVFISILIGDLFIQRPSHLKQASRYFWFCCYVPLFLWECFKANIDVALRVLNPRLPINPGIVKVKTALKSDTGLTFLANSITLTPGTFCVDIDVEEGFIYVHWIDVKTKDVHKATELVVSKFENILKRIFE